MVHTYIQKLLPCYSVFQLKISIKIFYGNKKSKKLKKTLDFLSKRAEGKVFVQKNN